MGLRRARSNQAKRPRTAPAITTSTISVRRRYRGWRMAGGSLSRDQPCRFNAVSGASIPAVELGQVLLQFYQCLMEPWREQSPSFGRTGLPAFEPQILEI